MPSIDHSSRVPRSARPLFVAGPPRSGTSGFTRYLNRHPEILVCIERYKYVAPRRISPELFSPERILDLREHETNIPRDRHVALVERKQPSRLKWIGDKYPHYVVRMEVLAKNNPGARFIVLHRPAEEVAESYQARASNPDDRWPAKNGFDVGIEHWNRAFQATRRFVEGDNAANVLIVDYHRFFYEPESFVPVLAAFLEIDFDEPIRAHWARMSARFAERRRPKREITPQQRELVEARKDRETEDWALDYIARQDGGGPDRSSAAVSWRDTTWERVRGALANRIRAGAKRP